MLRRAARQTLKKGDDSLETIYLGELYMENDFYKSVSFFFPLFVNSPPWES